MKGTLLLSLTLVLLLAACNPPGAAPPVTTQDGTPSKPLPTVSAPGADETPAPQDAPGAVVWKWAPAEKEYTASDDTVLMTVTLSLPAIDNPTGYAPWTAINDYYAAVAADLLRDAADQALWAADDYGMSQGSGFVFSPYYMWHEASLALETDKLVSITRTGGVGVADIEAERGTWTFSEQFDLTTGKRLHLADFFTGLASDAQALVLDAVKQAARDTEWGWEDALLERHFDPQRFYLTEAALVVFYNPGTLTEATGQSVMFTIPYETLGEAWIGW